MHAVHIDIFFPNTFFSLRFLCCIRFGDEKSILFFAHTHTHTRNGVLKVLNKKHRFVKEIYIDGKIKWSIIQCVKNVQYDPVKSTVHLKKRLLLNHFQALQLYYWSKAIISCMTNASLVSPNKWHENAKMDRGRDRG